MNSATDNRSFGSWVKQRRKDLGLTQPHLAHRIACSVETIDKIESGKRRPSEQVAALLAECLGVPPEERSQFVEFARAEPTFQESLQPPSSNSSAPWRTFHRVHHPSNLPAELNELIGRGEEVEAACSLLRRPGLRLLTFHGPPGVGKSRLGVRVASELVTEFSDGVFLASLAPVTDPGLVIPTISSALRVQEVGGRSSLEGLKVFLRDKQMLLLLDNFEQVIAAAPLVADLLEAAPRLKALVTSRVMLDVYGEHDFEVPPLSLPSVDPSMTASLDLPTLDAEDWPDTRNTFDDPEPRYGEGRSEDAIVDCLLGYDSVRLFVERAQAVKSNFKLTRYNAWAVSEVCRRLDGLPLAIELAASRVRLLTPQAMLARLESRLKLLTVGEQDLPARHRTLRSAIEWSYDLLDDRERALFRKLGIFVGGCTLEAIGALCPSGGDTATDRVLGSDISVLDGVESLIRKSLVQQLEGATGEPRFLLLETIREFAKEKLEEADTSASNGGEMEEGQRLYAEYYLTLAENAEVHLTGKQQAIWLARLEEEHDNLRSVFDWVEQRLEHPHPYVTHVRHGRSGVEEGELGLRLGGALWWFWYIHGHLSEGRRRLAILLALDASTRSRQPAVRSEGRDSEIARRFTIRAEARARARAKVLLGAGWLAWTQGDHEGAMSFSNESLDLYRELGDKEGIARSLNNLGIVAQRRGDLLSARSVFEESLSISEEMGYEEGIAASKNNLGFVAKDQGEYSRARELLEESLAAKVELGDERGVAVSMTNLAEVAKNQGDYERSQTLYQESLARRVRLGYKWGFAGCLLGLANVAGLRGFTERAVRLWAAAELLREEMGTPLSPAELTEYECIGAAARAQLDEATWQRAWEEGRGMPVQQAILDALDSARSTSS